MCLCKRALHNTYLCKIVAGNRLQHTAANCNTLQHTALHSCAHLTLKLPNKHGIVSSLHCWYHKRNLYYHKRPLNLRKKALYLCKRALYLCSRALYLCKRALHNMYIRKRVVVSSLLPHCLASITKETNISPKEPHISIKETYISTQETYISYNRILILIRTIAS